MNRIEGELRTVSEWLNDIKKEVDEEVKNGAVNPKNRLRLARLYKLYYAVEKDKDSVKICDFMATNGAAKIFTEYIRMLTDSGKSDPPSGSDNSKSLEIVRSLCWNYSHVSSNFCLELGKAGLFDIIVSHLERCKDSLEDVTVPEDEFVLHFLAILHNCAKGSRARRYLAEAKILDVLPPYIRMKNTRLILSKIVAILTSSYPIEEGQSERPVDNSMLYVLVFYLEKAVSAPDHRSHHEYAYFTADELVDGLKRLSDNDLNKVSILNAGIVPLLEKLLETGDVGEKTIAALTLWNLCFAEENKSKLSENRQIMTSLQKLGKQPGRLGHVTSGAYWFLTDRSRSPTSLQGGKSLPSGNREQGASRGSAGNHIMISYSSRQKILALKIKACLEKLGYCVWVDMDGDEGKNFEDAKKAVEKSEVIVVCISQDYKTQPSCRMEAEYARKMQIPMIPILAESDYKMSGWLRSVLDSKVCIDFSDSDNFEKAVSRLAAELGDEGRKESVKTRVTNNFTSPARIEIQETQDKAASKTPAERWTTKDVMSWATGNNLSAGHFHNIDGESLAYLRDMKKNSPEFYHKYVVEKLGISDLQDLKNLSRGLENLKL